MLQSNQIKQENSYYSGKNMSIKSQGKVRVLSFNVDFSEKETKEKEDILLVKLPKGKIKLIQVGLNSIESTIKDEDNNEIAGTFDLINSNMIYSNIENSYKTIKDSVIKSGVIFSDTASSVLKVDTIVDDQEELNSYNYVKFRSSIPFSKKNMLDGYILYLAD